MLIRFLLLSDCQDRKYSLYCPLVAGTDQEDTSHKWSHSASGQLDIQLKTMSELISNFKNRPTTIHSNLCRCTRSAIYCSYITNCTGISIKSRIAFTHWTMSLYCEHTPLLPQGSPTQWLISGFNSGKHIAKLNHGRLKEQQRNHY